MARRIRSVRGERRFQIITAVTCIVVATVGTYLLVKGHALSPYANGEAENGTTSCGANIISDPGASGGKYVQFDASTCTPLSNPTHFDDTYWSWPSNVNGYTEMDTNITPEIDGTPDGYYFSAYYWFTGDYPATGGYLGLQTDGISNPSGKAAIFSIWGGTSASGPGFNQPFNEGGAGYTSRLSYQWVVNHTYDLRIALTSQSSGSNIWTATVIDTNTQAENLIGNITVPISRGNLYQTSVTFHERYNGATTSCSDMHTSQVTFTGLTANNGTISPQSHSNVQPTNSICAGDFATQDISNGIRTVIGGQLP